MGGPGECAKVEVARCRVVALRAEKALRDAVFAEADASCLLIVIPQGEQALTVLGPRVITNLRDAKKKLKKQCEERLQQATAGTDMVELENAIDLSEEAGQILGV